MNISRFARAASLLAMSAAISACASAPRSPAARLASAGTNLSSALSANTDRIAKDVALDPAIDAFYRIYALCDAKFLRKPPPTECAPQLTEIKQTQDSAKNLREYAQILRLEAAAFNAVGAAYGALKRESEYDAASEAPDAIDGAVTVIRTLAAAVPLTQLVPIEQLAKEAARGIAARRQTNRIMDANRRLRAVAGMLLIVQQEQQANVAFQLEMTERHRAQAMQVLVKEGVVSRSDLFAKILEDAHIAIATGGAAKIDASPVLRASVDAAIQQRAIDRLQNRLQDYDTTISALNALVAMHDQFHDTGAVNSTLVESLTARLVVEAAPTPAAATPTAPAVPASGGASGTGAGTGSGKTK
jgi:hypothetical protein